MSELSNERCLGIVTGILRLLKSTNQYEEVFHLLVDRITRLYKCQTCAIILIDPKTEYLKIENSIGVSHTFSKTFSRQISTGAIGNLYWTGNPILVPDSGANSELAEELKLERPFGSCVCVQIAVDHRTLGYIHVDSHEKFAFDEKDVQVLQAFGDFAGVAYFKSQLFEENMRLDRIDHETDLEKYAPFSEKLNENLDRARSFQEPLALLICDIDNFKRIAHTYGYDSSRQLLKEIGTLIRSNLRSMDVGGRYGYDEFIICRSNSGGEDAMGYAVGVRDLVEKATFTKDNLKTTISAGLAVFPQNGKSAEDLVLAAKKALYEAQRTGRNKVVQFPSEWHAFHHSEPAQA